MSCPSETISEPLGGPKVIPQITSTETPVNQSALGADPTNTYSDGGTGGIGNSIHPPSNRPLSGGGFSGGEMAAGEPSNYAANIASDTTLGSLSAKYEANGNPKIIGRDSTGGYSYGEYQIATKVGTFGNYMDFLQTHHPDTYNELQAAGGESAARAGTPAFKSAWKRIMSDPAHAESQHAFIQATHYNPAVNKIIKSTELDFTTRSKPVQDALWSTAVQHGPGGANKVIRNAIVRSGKTAQTITDEELIIAIYDERGDNNGNKYFPSSKPHVKASVVNRFRNEKADALSALA